jgi:hypothetical protein
MEERYKVEGGVHLLLLAFLPKKDEGLFLCKVPDIA